MTIYIHTKYKQPVKIMFMWCDDDVLVRIINVTSVTYVVGACAGCVYTLN